MTYFTENMGNLQRSLIVLEFYKFSFYYNRAIGFLGRWLIAKYLFSRFEDR